MRKNSALSLLAITTLTAVFFVTGCQKESSTTGTTEQQEEQALSLSSESETKSQFVFEDVSNNVFGVGDDIAFGGVGIFGRTDASGSVLRVDQPAGCVTVTVTPAERNAFPKTVTMDFGKGCSINGHERSGKIVTVYTGRLIEPGKSATTTFENYKIDDISVEGTHKITNTTTPGANHRQFTIEVNGAKLTQPNGNFEEWASKRIHTQIEGNGTAMPSDDIFRITGGGRGKTKHGDVTVTWKAEITEPLIKKFTCRWITKGIIKTVREGLPSDTRWVGTLDFGNGDCDNKATLTVNGKERQIVLR